MGKGKLKKFAELEHFENVYQKPEPKLFKGKWASDIFKNNNEIILELACGKGDYTLALAKQFPTKNFIGVDIKGNRIHVGARKALANKMDNVRFLRIFIDHIDAYFDREISEIWITFPDPYLKDRNANKRLTSPKFLQHYQAILKANAPIHLKTDSPQLFSYTKEVIEEYHLPTHEVIEDVYANVESTANVLTDIKTYYEKKHLQDGRTIRYIRFGVEGAKFNK